MLLACEVIRMIPISTLQRIGLLTSFRSVGAGFSFLLVVLIGRGLGPAGAGTYFTMIAAVSICTNIGLMGIDHYALQQLSHHRARKDWRGAFEIASYTAVITAIAIIVASMILALIMLFLPDTHRQLAPTAAVTLFSLSVIPMGITRLLSEQLKALNRQLAALATSAVVPPVTALAICYGTYETLTIESIAVAHLAGYLSGGVIGAVALALFFREKDDVTVPIWRVSSKKGALGHILSAFPLWVMSVINGSLTPWLPVLMLGAWSNPESVGVLGAVTRVILAIALILSSVNAYYAPKLSAIYQDGGSSKLGPVLRNITKTQLLLLGPFIALLMMFADEVMKVFGVGFWDGGVALRIVLVGQLLNISAGCAGYALLMTGFSRENQNAALAAAIAVTVVGLSLIPTYGLVGGAIAVASGTITNNLFNLLMVKRRLGIGFLNDH